MAPNYFFLRLIPPRATFARDMTDAERATMREHAAYFQKQFERGRVVVYGPVLLPLDAFGMAVVEAADEAEVRAMMDVDPSVASGLNRYELAPMHVAASRALEA